MLIQHNSQTVGFEKNSQVQSEFDPYFPIDKINIFSQDDIVKIHIQNR